jgi:hypothetical protein
VDQARRLMLNLQRVDDARTLLDEAERGRGLAPDELAAERAWVDLEESRIALANGDDARATAAHARATAAVDQLRVRWPEWAVPYTILTELRRSAVADGSAGALADPLAFESDARHRFVNGAVMRSLTRPQALVIAFLAGALAVLGLAMVASAAGFIREMRRTETSVIAGAQPGFVELTGTLHLPARADAVIGPLTKHSGVWYAVETNFGGSKGSRTFRERSSQFFLLRDATGEVEIDPAGMTVHTRHSVTRFGNASGITSSRRTTERMLWEGDETYVLGELALGSAHGVTTRRIRQPEDGRRLIVANYSEAELIRRERRWLVVGGTLLLLSVATILWGAVQRYGVRTMPGVLE